MLSLHTATPTDLNAIQKIANETWPSAFGAILSREQIEYMLEMMYSSVSLEEQINKGHHFLIVKEENDDLAFASYELHYNGLPKTKIHKIYTLPTAQNKGIGKLLMNAIIEKAKENQDTTLTLNVNRYNTAYEFYKRLGFEQVGEENIDIGQGYLMEDFIMEKVLV